MHILLTGAADEKFNQGLFTFNGRLVSFIEYVDKDKPELEVLEQYQQQLLSLAKVANDDCNSAKDIFYKFMGSKSEAERYYELPNFGYVWDVSHKCGSIAAIAAGSPGLPDPKKLATDKTFRDKFLEGEKGYQKETDDLLRIQRENYRERINYRECTKTNGGSKFQFAPKHVGLPHITFRQQEKNLIDAILMNSSGMTTEHQTFILHVRSFRSSSSAAYSRSWD